MITRAGLFGGGPRTRFLRRNRARRQRSRFRRVDTTRLHRGPRGIGFPRSGALRLTRGRADRRLAGRVGHRPLGGGGLRRGHRRRRGCRRRRCRGRHRGGGRGRGGGRSGGAGRRRRGRRLGGGFRRRRGGRHRGRRLRSRRSTGGTRRRRGRRRGERLRRLRGRHLGLLGGGNRREEEFCCLQVAEDAETPQCPVVQLGHEGLAEGGLRVELGQRRHDARVGTRQHAEGVVLDGSRVDQGELLDLPVDPVDRPLPQVVVVDVRLGFRLHRALVELGAFRDVVFRDGEPERVTVRLGGEPLGTRADVADLDDRSEVVRPLLRLVGVVADVLRAVLFGLCRRHVAHADAREHRELLDRPTREGERDLLGLHRHHRSGDDGTEEQGHGTDAERRACYAPQFDPWYEVHGQGHQERDPEGQGDPPGRIIELVDDQPDGQPERQEHDGAVPLDGGEHGRPQKKHDDKPCEHGSSPPFLRGTTPLSVFVVCPTVRLQDDK